MHNDQHKIVINKIYLIRSQKVMLDRDLADLYDVKPIRLREQVKRNAFRDCKEITNHFDSFFFPFSSLKSSTIAMAMHDNFALTKKKINLPASRQVRQF